jgi:hypothetical protein
MDQSPLLRKNKEKAEKKRRKKEKEGWTALDELGLAWWSPASPGIGTNQRHGKYLRYTLVSVALSVPDEDHPGRLPKILSLLL